MILGIPTAVFTQLHVLISLIGIVTGIVVLFAMLKGHPVPGLGQILFRYNNCDERNGIYVPTQAEPPFAIAQGLVLVGFIALGIIAAKDSMNERTSTVTTASRRSLLVGGVGAQQASPNRWSPAVSGIDSWGCMQTRPGVSFFAWATLP